MSKALGKVLKILRRRNELTQKQVADVLHIDRSTYAYYESGVTEPDLKSVNLLAKIFNVEPACLLPNSDGTMNVSLHDIIDEPTEDNDTEDYNLDPKDEKLYSLSKEERGFVIWYRTLSLQQKEKLREMLEEGE